MRKVPRQARSRALFQAIVEATFQVIEQSGVEHVTTWRVANVAGVSVGSLYQYFPNRNALLAMALAGYLEALASNVRAELESSRGQPMMDVLRAATRGFVEAKRDLFQVAQKMKPLLAEETSQHLVQTIREQVLQDLSTAVGYSSDAVGKVDSFRVRSALAVVEALVHEAAHHGPENLEREDFPSELAATAFTAFDPPVEPKG